MKKRKFVLKDEDIRGRCKAYVGTLKCDGKIEVVVDSFKEDKSAEQRAYFHICCRLLGKEVGYTEGQVKTLVKKETYGTEIVQVGDRVVEYIPSSEDADKDLYSSLIETVLQLGAEAGIVLPDPRFQ